MADVPWRPSCSSADSLADRFDVPDVREELADLAALEMADEVPRERAGIGLRLRHEILRAVLADELDAGLSEYR